jgi:DNA-binding NarL/FixJ family response regulator
MAIKILLADDHAVLRQGIKALLETDPEFRVVGEASDGFQAVTEADRLQPDVVLLDYSMSGLDGLQATRRIKQKNEQIRVLILTQHEDEEYVLETLRAGAAGYLVKDLTAETLFEAIRAVARGESYLSPRVSRRVIQQATGRGLPGEGAYPRELTPRESEILRLLADGATAKEVGRALNISTKTVETHRTHIMKKLGLKNRADLVKYAIRRKIIQP